MSIDEELNKRKKDLKNKQKYQKKKKNKKQKVKEVELDIIIIYKKIILEIIMMVDTEEHIEILEKAENSMKEDLEEIEEIIHIKNNIIINI